MGSKRHLRIGTRKSTLARVQAAQIQRAVVNQYPDWTAELVLITTQGDRFIDTPIASLDGKGVFLKELEEALLQKEIDCAVHSMKDVPTETHPELHIGIIPRRDDPRDALISHNSMLTGLPQGASIGTGSSRRHYQLLACRPDIKVKPVRGNVDTRIRKWQDGQYDALVLAMAGIKRLGLEHLVTEIIRYDILLPAAGQGALGVELRAGDRQLLEELLFLDNRETHAAIAAERAFLAEIGGGCRLPVGVYGTIQDNTLHLMARIIDEVTMRIDEGKASGTITDAAKTGRMLAWEILNKSAER